MASSLLTGKLLKKVSIFSGETSYGRFPIKATYGGSVGILLMSTSAPREAFGAVGSLDLSIDELGYTGSVSGTKKKK